MVEALSCVAHMKRVRQATHHELAARCKARYIFCNHGPCGAASGVEVVVGWGGGTSSDSGCCW